MLGAGGLPQRRAAGGRDARWRGGFTQMAEDVAHGRAGGDKGDDPLRATAAGANQRNGETLLNYNKREPWALRFGYAIWR